MSLRVAFFGVGSASSRIVFDDVIRNANVVALVLPAPRVRGWRSILARLLLARAEGQIRRTARARGIPILRFGGPSQPILDRLRALSPDLLCVATFPYILDQQTRDVARLGALNLHPSLLPHHRGADPLFWTYFADDRETGITLHWMDGGVDTGDIVAQERMPLARGTPRATLEKQLAREGASLLAKAIAALEQQQPLPRNPQASIEPTREPAPTLRNWAIDFQTWSAERVWHFLHSGARVLRDGRGRAFFSRAPIDFRTATHQAEPGTTEVADDRIRVFCRDGWVDLATPALWRRLIARLLMRRPK